MANKQVVIVGAVVVAAVIGFVALRGNKFPPGTEGTIGAAQRYSSEQITPGDVSLESPAVAAFIQSDTFRKLAANPEFAKSAAELGRIIGSDALRTSLGSGDLGRFVAEAGFQNMVSADALRQAVSDGSLSAAASAADLGRLVAEPGFARALEAAKGVVGVEGFQQFAEAARKAGTNVTDLNRMAADYAGLKESAEFGKFMGDPDAAKVIAAAGPEFFALLGSADAAKIVGSEAFRGAVGLDALRSMAGVDGFRGVVEGMKDVATLDALRSVAGTDAGRGLLGNPDMLGALAAPELAQIAQTGELARAVEMARAASPE